MKNFIICLLFTMLCLMNKVQSQNMAINTDGSTPDASAMLDIASTSKGFLAPRMTTTQQNAISLPAIGLLVFNTTDNVFKVNTGTPASPVWTALSVIGGSVTSLNGLSTTAQTFTTGTSGSNFGITSAGTTHTFNLPSASASNRGVLTTTDWSTFNAKEPAITASNSIKRYLNGYKQFVSLNTDSITEGSTNLYYTNARVQAAITGTVNRITETAGVVDISSAYVGQTSLTTLGTIGTGTWNGTAIGTIYGGTGQSTVTTGDLLYGSASNTWSKLGAGSNGQVLTLAGGIPSWAAQSAGWATTGNTVTPVSQFLGSTNNTTLRFRTNNIERMVIDSTGKVGIGTSAPTSDFTVSQSAGFSTAKGMRFTGNSVGGTSSGTGFAMTLGYNAANNKQLWLGDADYLGNSAATFYRISASGGYSIIDAVAGDNSVRRPVSFGTGGDPVAGVILGSDGISTAPSSFVWANGNMAVGNGYRAVAAPPNGLIVQGSIGIGTSAFDGINPEKFLVDAGNTSSVNAFVGRGSINSYLQLNIQNTSSGNSSSSDLVATANNGDESSNYVDMGINGGNNTSGIMGGPNDGYLYTMGNNFLLGTGNASKSLIFMTGGMTQSTNERMRIDGTGNMGIGTTSPTQKLDISGNLRVSGAFMPNNNAGTSGYVLRSNGTNSAPTWIDGATLLSSTGWLQNGNSVSSVKSMGTTSNQDLPFITNNIERMRIKDNGNIGIGTNSPNSTLTVEGSLSMNYRVGTGDYTILSSDYAVVNTGGSTPDWTLPLASSCPGRVYRLVNQGTTNLNLSQPITTTSSNTIVILSNNNGSNMCEIISDGTVWRKIAQ